MKSSGFLTTKYNEVLINNLVPFTLYNITISTVLHEVDKQIYFNTLETGNCKLTFFIWYFVFYGKYILSVIKSIIVYINANN